MDKGTTLSVDEIKKLQQGGFVLQGITEEISTRQSKRVHIANAGGKARPEFRDGQKVIYRKTVTKEMQDRIDSSITMDCVVVHTNVVQNREHVEFIIATAGSERRGCHYTVTVSIFPSCTCEDFIRRACRVDRYFPCKHIYHVFLKILGLDLENHKLVHQAALTKEELHDALSRVVLA